MEKPISGTGCHISGPVPGLVLPLPCPPRYLALVSGLASGADWLFIPESPPEDGWEDLMCERLGEVSGEGGGSYSLVPFLSPESPRTDAG